MADNPKTTLAQFLIRHRIKMRATVVEKNPNWTAEDDGTPVVHYRCTFYNMRGVEFAVYFTAGGEDMNRLPTGAWVLDAVRDECRVVERARTVGDFAVRAGIDPEDDREKAEWAYRIVKSQAECLKGFLGEAAYTELLFETRG